MTERYSFWSSRYIRGVFLYKEKIIARQEVFRKKNASCLFCYVGKDGNDYETILYSRIRNRRTSG